MINIIVLATVASLKLSKIDHAPMMQRSRDEAGIKADREKMLKKVKDWEEKMKLSKNQSEYFFQKSEKPITIHLIPQTKL